MLKFDFTIDLESNYQNFETNIENADFILKCNIK